MDNNIIKFLNIEDENIIISNIIINGHTKEIYLEKTLKPEFCPACSSRRFSAKTYFKTEKMEMHQSSVSSVF